MQVAPCLRATALRDATRVRQSLASHWGDTQTRPSHRDPLMPGDTNAHHGPRRNSLCQIQI
jgi:hypothetical protein